MVVVRSVKMLTLTEGGMDSVSCGRSALMRSTTVMMFAPGCRCTLTMTAGTSFIQAAWRTFSTSSSTEATSVNLTGEPFRYAMISGV